MATRVLELETLLVRITANATQYMNTTRGVLQQGGRIISMMEHISRQSNRTATQLNAMALAMMNVTRSIEGMAASANTFIGIGNIGPGMAQLANGLRDIVAISASAPQLRRLNDLLGNLQNFARDLDGIRQNFRSLSQISGIITRFVERASEWGGGLANLATFTRRLNGFARNFRNWNAEFGVFQGISDHVNRFISSVNMLASMGPVLNQAATTIGTFSESLRGTGLTRMVGVARSLHDFAGVASTINFGAITNLGNSLSSFPSMMATNFAALETVPSHLTAFHAAMDPNMTKLRALAKKMDGLVPMATALNHFARLISMGVSWDELPRIGRELNKFGNAVAGKGWQNMMNNLGNLAGLPKAGAYIAGFVNQFQNVNVNNLHKIWTSINHMQAFGRMMGTKSFQTLTTIPVGSLNNLGSALSGFIGQFANINPATFATMLTTTGALQKFFAMLGTKSVQSLLTSPKMATNLLALGKTLALFSNSLSGINISNLNAVSNALNAAAAAAGAFRGSAAGRGGGANLLTGFGSPSGAAHAFGFAAGTADKFAFQVQLLRFGIVGFGIASAIAFARFDDAITRSMSVVRNATPRMRRELEDLIVSITMTGRSITSPTELAESFGQLAQAGLSAAQAMESLEVVDRFVMVSMMETGKATEALIAIMNNYRLTVMDLERISDVIIEASESSLGSAEDFAAALQRTSGIAHQAGMSLEETAAAITLLSRAGITGSEAGTSLMRTLTTIHNAAIAGSGVWQGYDIAVRSTTGGFLPFDQILRNISERIRGLPDMERERILINLGIAESGGTNVNRALAAMIDNWAQLGHITRRYEGALGTTVEKANALLRSFGNQMKVLWNQVKTALVMVGQILVPPMLILGLALSTVAKALVLIPGPAKTVGSAFIIVAGATWLWNHALTWLSLKLTQAASAALLFVQTLSATQWFFYITAALLALAYHTDTGKKAFEEMGKAVSDIFNSITPLLEVVAMAAVPVVQVLSSLLLPILTVLAAILKPLASFLKSDFGQAFLKVAGQVAVLVGILYLFRLALMSVQLGQFLFNLAVVIGAIAGYTIQTMMATAATWGWVGALAVLMLKVTVATVAIAALLEVFSLITGQGSLIDKALSGMGLTQAGGMSNFPGQPPVPIGQITGYRTPSGEEIPVWMENFGRFIENVFTFGNAAESINEPIFEYTDEYIRQLTNFSVRSHAEQMQAAALGGFRGEFQQVRFADMAITEPGGLAFVGGNDRTAVSDTRTHELLEQIRDNPDHILGD